MGMQNVDEALVAYENKFNEVLEARHNPLIAINQDEQMEGGVKELMSRLDI